jgi:hypothetical protein
MDMARFDRWTRDLVDRRAALGLFVLGGFGFLGLSAPAPAKRKHKKRRCKKSERGCARSAQCCHNLECTDGLCCQPERVFISCLGDCRCDDNPEFCCADQPEPPAGCIGPLNDPPLCCPRESICGDQCCNPEWSACDRATLTCKCILPDILDCPSGGGVYIRVRRLR